MLNSALIIDNAFASMAGATDLQMTAYSGFTLLNLMEGKGDKKALRRDLAAHAANTGRIAKNTWESYAKAVEVAADKLATHLADDAEFLAIFNMGEVEAVDEIRKLYEGLDILSGSDIREWSKAPGFEPLDKEAVKRARKAASDQKKLDEAQASLALRRATAKGFGGAVATMSPAEVVAFDPMAALLASIGAIGSTADALAALDALNGKIAELRALAALPLPTSDVAPVTADDATHAPNSAQAVVAADVAKLASHFSGRKAA